MAQPYVRGDMSQRWSTSGRKDFTVRFETLKAPDYLELVRIELASLDPVRLLLSQLWQALTCSLEGSLLRVHGSRGRLAQSLLLALPQLPVQV